MDTKPLVLFQQKQQDLVAIKKIGSNSRRRSCSGRIELDFAPMVDVARDARWGRVMEGAGGSF
jgi:beta-glucosidase